MMTILNCAKLAVAALLATTCSAKLPGTWNKASKWQVEIQSPLKIPADAKQKLVPDAGIWDIDLWHAWRDPSIADALHARGKTVICYFNLGAVQPDDCDFPDWYNNKIWNGPWYFDANGGADQGDRYCERYENFTDTALMKRMKRRLVNATQAGCDGVDPDNIDIWNLQWGGRGKVSEQAVVAALKDLAAYAHSLTTKLGNPLLIGQKNAPTIASKLAPHFDFAVLEKCLTPDSGDEFCSSFASYLAAGKPVVDIEYPDSLKKESDKKNGCNLSGISGADRAEVCQDLEGSLKDMSTVLKLNLDEFGLNGCTQYCDSSVVITPTNQDSDKVCSNPFKNCESNNELVKNCCCEACRNS